MNPLLQLFHVFVFQLLLSKCKWKEHKSDTGKIYFHNSETKESRWTKPPELQEVKGKVLCVGTNSMDSFQVTVCDEVKDPSSPVA